MRINKKVLSGKKYADIMFLGDIHFGHNALLLNKLQEDINYCLKTNTYVVGMGDYMECGIKSSIGDSVYSQELDPDKQQQRIKELLFPLSRKRLLLGLLEGNHEYRITKTTGINITRIIAEGLNVPFLGSACYNWLKLGKQNYSVYVIHGDSSAKLSSTKLKAAIDIANNHDCDVFAMGHVHDKLNDTIQYQCIDYRNKVVKTKQKLVVITGHYLRYSGSYAEMKGMSIGKNGSQIIRFYKEKHAVKLL